MAIMATQSSPVVTENGNSKPSMADQVVEGNVDKMEIDGEG